MPDTERSLRARAVDLSLKLMDASRRLFPTTAKFHFAIFLIFDTAAFLCSAIVHVNSRSLHQRDKVIEAIGMGVSIMEQLSQLTKSGATCYAILRKLVANLYLSSEERIAFHPSFLGNSGIRPRSSEAEDDLSASSPGNVSTPNAVSSEMFSTRVELPQYRICLLQKWSLLKP